MHVAPNTEKKVTALVGITEPDCQEQLCLLLLHEGSMGDSTENPGAAPEPS